jgi:hypothetical protein
MSRLKIVHYRVADINDPKIANVALGELFNDISGNVFYKRHDNGNIIQVTSVSALNSLPWSGITSKPTTINGFGITIVSNDIPTLDKSKITFGTGNSTSTFGITLASSDLPTISGLTPGTYTKLTVNNKGQVISATNLVEADIPTLDKSKINFGSSNSVGTFGITLADTDIPTLDKSKINFGINNTISTFNIVLSAGDIPTTLPSIAFNDPPTATDDPVGDNDLTRRAWVLDQIDQNVNSGLSIFDPVRVATVSNLNLAVAITNIDGLNLFLNDRVLVKNQTNLTQNGIYYLTAGNILQRSVDADNSGELSKNAYVFVSDGLTNKASSWVVKDIVTTIGTDPIIWRQFNASSTYSFTNGLSITGSTVSIANIVGLTTGTFTKVTVNARGQVTNGGTLLASDIPTLDKAKITFGTGNTLSTFGIAIATEIGTYSPALKSIKDLTLTPNKILTTVDVSGTVLFEQNPITTLGKTILAKETSSELLTELNVVRDTIEVISLKTGFTFTGLNVIKEVTPTDNGKIFVINNDGTAIPSHSETSPFIIHLDNNLTYPDNFKIKVVNNLRAKKNTLTWPNAVQTNITLVTDTNIIFPKHSRLNGSTVFNTAGDIFNLANKDMIFTDNSQNPTNKLLINTSDEITLQYKTGIGFFVINEILCSEITTPVVRNTFIPSGSSDAFNNFFPSMHRAHYSMDGIMRTNGGSNVTYSTNTNIFGNALYLGNEDGTLFNGSFEEFFNVTNHSLNAVNTSFSVANTSFGLAKVALVNPLTISFSKGNKEYYATLTSGETYINNQEWQYIYAEYDPNSVTNNVSLKVSYCSAKYLSNYDAMAEAYACSNLADEEIDPLKELAMGNLSPFRIGSKLVKYHATCRVYLNGNTVARCNNVNTQLTVNPYVSGLPYNEQAPILSKKGLFGSVISTDISRRSLFTLQTDDINATALREAKSGNLYSPHLAYSFWFAVDTNEMAFKDTVTGKQGILVLASNAASTSTIYLERDVENLGDDYTFPNYQPSKLKFRVIVTNNNTSTVSFVAVTQNFELLPMKYVNIIVEMRHNSPVKVYVNGTKLNLTTSINLVRPPSIPDLNTPYIKFEKFFYNRFNEYGTYY